MEVVFEGFSVIQKQGEIKIPTKARGSSFLLFMPRQLRATPLKWGKPVGTFFDARHSPGRLSSLAPSPKAAENERKFQQGPDCNTC